MLLTTFLLVVHEWWCGTEGHQLRPWLVHVTWLVLLITLLVFCVIYDWQVFVSHIILHGWVEFFIDEASLTVHCTKMLFRHALVSQCLLTLQIFHADIVPTKLLKHFCVKDSLLFLFEHPVLEFKLLFVLLHWLSLLIFGRRGGWRPTTSRQDCLISRVHIKS